jgi:hypothetical protein
MHQQTKRALDRLKQSGIAERVVMPDEDTEQFFQLCDDLLLELAPRGRLQEEYVRRIAELLWKKQQPRMRLAVEAKESSQQIDTRSQAVIETWADQPSRELAVRFTNFWLATKKSPAMGVAELR